MAAVISKFANCLSIQSKSGIDRKIKFFLQSSSCSSRSIVSSSCLSEFITVMGKRLTHLSICNNKMSGLPFVFKALSVSDSAGLPFGNQFRRASSFPI